MASFALCFTMLIVGVLFGVNIPRPTAGVASWYGEVYRGLPMANGQPYDPDAMTCATWAYPLGTVLHVRAVGGAAIVKVTVTDRGPAKRLNRLIDLTPVAFGSIAPLELGIVMVEVWP